MQGFQRSLLIGTVALLAAAPVWAAPATYTIDPSHSQVIFKVKHLGISTVTGSFSKVSGTFDLDPADIKSFKTTAQIDPASISTNVENRDKHLKSPDFFDVEKFPEMSFVSKSVEPADNNRLKIAGDLTMHGVTKPVVLDAEIGGTMKDQRGGQHAGITATTTIQREDFGLTWNKPLADGGFLVSKDVKVELSIEGGIKPPETKAESVTKAK